MGNCQAAEAATVVIQHPGGSRVERMYWSVSANDVMRSNPGHYVAMVINSPAAKTENGSPVKQLKLLRSEDTLLLGQVYRLVSFEDVLKEFAAKKCVKLGKLLKRRGAFNIEPSRNQDTNSNSNSSTNSNSNSSDGGVPVPDWKQQKWEWKQQQKQRRGETFWWCRAVETSFTHYCRACN